MMYRIANKNLVTTKKKTDKPPLRQSRHMHSSSLIIAPYDSTKTIIVSLLQYMIDPANTAH